MKSLVLNAVAEEEVNSGGNTGAAVVGPARLLPPPPPPFVSPQPWALEAATDVRTVAAAMAPVGMTLVDYVTAYRSPAGTGHGLTFGVWN